jgi:predicted ATPase
VVEGEPGIGKTFVLTELRREAEARGFVVLEGSAAEFERDLPFGVLVDALEAHVAAGGDGIREDWDGGLVEELATFLPSLRSRRGEPASGADERHLAHRALRRLLELIAAASPAVVVLDDLHWADRASIEVIAALLRRGTSAPVMLALGYRTGQAPVELVAALAAPRVTIIELAPLTREEAARLAGDAPTPDQLSAILLEGGGNPFYTLQLARAARLPARSATGDRLAERAGVPRLVAAALVDELQGQTPAGRLLLDAAAIAGDPFDPDLAGQIAEQAPDAVTSALDDLLAAGLVRATAEPRQFAFRHPVVRRAVYESAPGGWRLAAHARAAALLGERGASATVRAHHVEQSAVAGDREAIALLLEAGDADAPRAPAGAARWYAAAARLIPDADTGARFDVLVRLAEVTRSVGDLERCRESLLEAMPLVPAADAATRLRLTSACAACENFLGRHDDARRRLESGLARGRGRSDRPRVRSVLHRGRRADDESRPPWSRHRAGPGRRGADRRLGGDVEPSRRDRGPRRRGRGGR